MYKYTLQVLWKLLLLFILLFLLTGCPGNNSEDNNPTPTPIEATPDPTPIHQYTIFFEEENGEIHFFTNELDYITPYGMTFWIIGNKITDVMDTLEVECRKISGEQNPGYGVSFCVEDIENFLIMLINTNGNYLIGKILNSNYNEILGWTSSKNLSTGYGIINTIKIIYDSDREVFDLFFNGIKETEFEDNISPVFEKVGRYGYMVSISPNENFPEIGVDVWFVQNIPEDISLKSGIMKRINYE